MDWPLLVVLVVSAAALLPASLLTLQTREFRRFVRSRIAHPKTGLPTLPVMLFAPCKGLEPGLIENLRPLFEQDHGDYRLTLIVESDDDPAAAPIRKLIAEYPQLRARLIVAGRAHGTGQKVHNLLVATADCEDAQVLAFVDSDARPRRTWLRHLVQHLHHRKAAATGYRWFVPQRNTLPNLLLHSLNAAVASLVGPGKHHMLWGGAWAIRREVFEQLNLRQKWAGTLSDDLVAARELAAADLELSFEPACMTASCVDFSWRQMLEFVRRQYTVARFYTPRWWRLALLFCTVSQVVFWSSAVAAIVLAVQGRGNPWLPAGICGCLYATYVVRAWLRQRAAGDFLPHEQPALRAARLFDIWLSPLAGLANLAGLLASCWGSSLTWRGITYVLTGGGRICSMQRPGEPAWVSATNTTSTVPLAMPLRRVG